MLGGGGLQRQPYGAPGSTFDGLRVWNGRRVMEEQEVVYEESDVHAPVDPESFRDVFDVEGEQEDGQSK